MKSSVVTLNPTEIEVATVVGTYRHEISRKRGYSVSTYRSKRDPLEADIDAAGAELAASKVTDCRWNMTTGDDLAEPDLWPHVEVRHTTHEAGGLVFRSKDRTERLWVLVVGTMPTYHVAGWIRGEDVKRDEHRWEDVWKVPQAHLTRFGA